MVHVYCFMLLSVLTVLFIKPVHQLSDPEEVLSYSDKEELEHQAFWAYFQKLKKNRYDYRSIYKIHILYQRIDEKRTLYWLNRILPDYHLDDSDTYEKLLTDTIEKNRDLGSYGMAVMQLLHYHEPEKAKEFLDGLIDKNKEFVNYLYALTTTNDSLIESYLKKEIELSDSPEEALSYLTHSYHFQSRFNEIEKIIQDKRLENFVPNNIKMDIAFRTFHFADYFFYRCVQVFNGTSLFTFFCCMFILALWFYFLYTLDVFELEKRKWIITTVLAGAFMGLVCVYLYDVIDIYTPFTTGQSTLQDFLYSVFVIGGIEETVKIIPLLLLIAFTKEVNEPMDYVFFATLSALGLSIQEDFMYFNSESADVIYSRGIYTSLTHICDSSIIAYSLVLAKYYYKKSQALFFVVGFLLACITHGIYDFFIINIDIWIIPFFILLFQAWLFAHIVNNCLNNSPFFDQNKKLDISRLAVIVSGGLLLLMTIVFLYISIYINEEYAIGKFFYSLIFFSYPLYFLSICIHKIDLFPSHWESFSFRRLMNPKVFFGGIQPRYFQLVGNTITLTTYGKHTKNIAGQLPVKAKVLSREILDDYDGFFRIELEKEISIGKNKLSILYMCADEKYAPYLKETRNVSSIYVVASNPDSGELKKVKIDSVSVIP